MDLSKVQQSPFLRLPPELRLIIYDILLIHPPQAPGAIADDILTATPDYQNYEPTSNTSDSPSNISQSPRPRATLRIRTEDPASYSLRQPCLEKEKRSRFLIRSDRFRARCMWTTYRLMARPELSTRLLLTNARIHAEAAQLLYSSYMFDFDTHIEAIVPFLSDLTPFARNSIQSLRIVKRALPYQKHFDNAEWAAAMDYISTHLTLKTLSLGIVAGKPGPQGWDAVTPYTAADFEHLRETDGMEWIGDTLGIGGLERLEVDAVVEHCPPPMSRGMAVYVRFSASVDGGFAAFLRGKMVR